MNLYTRYLLPQLMDWSLSDADLARVRQDLLATVDGAILEIGFGSGLNLAHYPNHIRNITAIDANPGMSALAQKRIQAANIVVDHRVLNGEQLPMLDRSFDCVVSTLTLCSIANVQQALNEVYRVLKPNGRFFFLEHGLSPNLRTQKWQHRLTPVQKIIADGCHLDRDIRSLIAQRFDSVEIKQFEMANYPAVLAAFYQGIALKTS